MCCRRSFGRYVNWKINRTTNPILPRWFEKLSVWYVHFSSQSMHNLRSYINKDLYLFRDLILQECVPCFPALHLHHEQTCHIPTNEKLKKTYHIMIGTRISSVGLSCHVTVWPLNCHAIKRNQWIIYCRGENEFQFNSSFFDLIQRVFAVHIVRIIFYAFQNSSDWLIWEQQCRNRSNRSILDSKRFPIPFFFTKITTRLLWIQMKLTEYSVFEIIFICDASSRPSSRSSIP